MLSLSHLLPPPPADKVTSCEENGKLRAFLECEAKRVNLQLLGEYNVDVFIPSLLDNIRSASRRNEAREAFSSQRESIWQKFYAEYSENGFISATQKLSEEKNLSIFIRKGVQKMLKVIDKIEKANYMFRERSPAQLLEDKPAISTSVVNIAWHPHTTVLAVVFADDTIRIYGSGRALSPLLKHRLQKQITEIQWMPYCASVLAVGCHSGILLWNLDPVSVVTRPSGSCLSVLASDCIPITSITWHPKGTRIACVGEKGREILVWDIASENNCTVHLGVASCISLVKWSPDGNRLLAAMSTPSIKVFECRNWTFEKWSLACPLQSAVWSRCGRFLLFATVSEPFVFCLTFNEEGGGVGGSRVATQVADVTALRMACEDGDEVQVGGAISQLSWDPKSERLAVLFKDTEFVALFHTYTFPQLHLAPGGFVRGAPGKSPKRTCFQNNVPDGAVLTSVWSGGEVKHLPLRYTSYVGQAPPSRPTAVNRSVGALASPAHLLNQSKLLNESLLQQLPSSPLASPLPSLYTSVS